MNEIELDIRLDEGIYTVLAQYAAIRNRDISTVVNELLAERLGDLSLRTEQEQVRSLPLQERQALARGAWGSWSLPAGTNSVNLVRQLRSEWTR